MAGEVMLINPRRRRHRRKRARARVRRARPARRRRRYALANPRRRRRHVARRRHARRRRHRVHSNPRLGSFFGINIGQVAMVGAGFVGTNIASAQLVNILPAEWNAKTGPNAPIIRAGAKVAVAVGGGMVLKMFKQHSLANAWTLGGGIAAVVDLATSYLLPAIGLSDYESGMVTGYESGFLTGGAPGAPSDYVDSTGPYGGSIYG